MPSIMPISDLRDYTEVLKEVDKKNRVYLTKNGHGAYVIMTVEEADELDCIKVGRDLAADLKRAEERAELEGWIDADVFDKEMGIIE